jgi:hypothetical protein
LGNSTARSTSRCRTIRRAAAGGPKPASSHAEANTSSPARPASTGLTAPGLSPGA